MIGQSRAAFKAIALDQKAKAYSIFEVVRKLRYIANTSNFIRFKP